MTQLKLGLSLPDRVAAWAAQNEGARFWELCDAFPELGASDVDIAAREAGALHWANGGYEVCAPSGQE
jgi:hypothetical protein